MRPRHVALNALFYEPDRSAGTETYLLGLVPALAAGFPGTRFTLITTRKGGAALRAAGWADFCDVVVLGADEGQRLRRLRAEQLAFPRVAVRRGADLLHSLANLGPVRAPLPTVLTLHDVTFFHHRTFSALTTYAMRAIVAQGARRAGAVVTVSDAARADIVATLPGVAPERVVVAYNGAGRPVLPAPLGADEVRARHRLAPADRVVLCVAAFRPHKNQEVLVRALARLPRDVVLVCCGHPELYVERLRELAAECGVADRVRLAGYVDDGELEGLWALAGCAAFPTRAEGFGLPVVEALRRGVGVACSALPVLREVGGDLPHYFPPDDPEAAAAAIVAALADPLGERGRERAARFTWERAAERTYEAYELALR